MIDQTSVLRHAPLRARTLHSFAPPGRQRRYRHVLLATDFAATTDGYHRRVAAIAHRLGQAVSLMQLQPEAGPAFGPIDCDRSSTAILLDGLAQRLALRPESAWITEFAHLDPTLSSAVASHGVDLIITGAPASAPQLRHCRRIAELGVLLGCRVVTLDDVPERD